MWIIGPHYVVSVHWNVSRRSLPVLKNTGFEEKWIQTQNFCSTQFISQDAQTISIYLLCPILRSSIWPADCFTATGCFDLSCFFCNKWTLYLWISVGKSVAHRSDKPLNADKSSALHLQICATQRSTSFCRKVADFMNSERTSPVANSVMHWRIFTYLDVSAALLYTIHCN